MAAKTNYYLSCPLIVYRCLGLRHCSISGIISAAHDHHNLISKMQFSHFTIAPTVATTLDRYFES